MAINLETFAKDLTYQADTSVGQIFKDLKEIAEIKQLAEQKVAYLRTLAVGSWGIVLIIIIGLFFGFFNGLTTFIGLGFVILAVLLLPVLIVAAILCYFKWNYYDKLKLRDDRYELSKKIVSMVNRDLAPNSNVKILIHFTHGGEKGKKIQTLSHPRKRGWINIFEDQWLTLEGKFLDSTNFFLTVTELNRTTYRRKAGGKLKSTKNKPKGTQINLKLSFPSKKYGSIHVIQKAAPEAVKLPEEVNLKRMKVTGKALDLTVNTPHFFKQEEMYQTITMMFLSLYQILNFAKLLSKKRA